MHQLLRDPGAPLPPGQGGPGHRGGAEQSQPSAHPTPTSTPTPIPHPDTGLFMSVCQAAFQPTTAVREPLSHTGMVTKNVPNGLTLWTHPPKSAKQVQLQVASTSPGLTTCQTDLSLPTCERQHPVSPGSQFLPLHSRGIGGAEKELTQGHGDANRIQAHTWQRGPRTTLNYLQGLLITMGTSSFSFKE